MSDLTNGQVVHDYGACQPATELADFGPEAFDLRPSSCSGRGSHCVFAGPPAHPWVVESELLATVNLPLNLDQNRQHAFHSTLSALRRAAKLKAAGLPIGVLGSGSSPQDRHFGVATRHTVASRKNNRPYRPTDRDDPNRFKMDTF